MQVMTKRAHVWVSGRVQGVYFRQSAKHEAERLGLHGWVRNLSDGRVEGLVEGPVKAVDAWVRWCHQGPAAAHVESVTVAEESVEGESAEPTAGFHILPTV